MSQIKKKTNLQQILDDIGISQAQLALLANMEKYQVSNIASGTKPDCYTSTAKRICKALSKISKRDVTMEDVFGDKPVAGKFRKAERKPKDKSEPEPPITPTIQESEPISESEPVSESEPASEIINLY